MKITIRTDVSSEVCEPKSVAINFESADIVNIANSKGRDAANKAVDNLVNKYTQDIKRLITEVLNK